MASGKLAPWDVFYRRLQRWKAQPAAEPLLLELREPEVAYPKIPLMAPECPGLVVFSELRKRHWAKVAGKVVHTREMDKIFDGRPAGISRKFYYQSLLQLDKSLECCGGSMPSNSPALFYRLLLAGQRTVVGLKDADYRRLFKALAKGADTPLLAAALEDAAPPEPPKLAIGGFVGGKSGDQLPARKRPRPPPLPDDDPLPPAPRAKPAPRPLAPPEPIPLDPPRAPTPPRDSGGGGGGHGTGGGSDPGGDDVPDPPPVIVPVPLAWHGGGQGPPAERRGPRRGPREFLVLDDGSSAYRDYYEPKDGKTPFFTWYLRCNRHGTECQRRREVREKSTKTYGELECIAYLRVWLDHHGTPDTIDTHSHRANDAEVEAWMHTHAEDFMRRNGATLRALGLPAP